MQVLCIDNTAKVHPECKGNWIVKEGEIYTVIGGFETFGEWFYQLEEDPAGNGWNSIYFIPLSEIEETTLSHAAATI